MNRVEELQKRLSTATSLQMAHEVMAHLCDLGVNLHGAVLCATSPVKDLMSSLHKLGKELQAFRPIRKGHIVALPCHLETADPVSQAVIWSDDEKGIAYVLSYQQKRNLDHVVSYLQRMLLPELCRVYLRTSEFRKGLNALVSSTGVTLRVREHTSKSLIEDPDSHKRVRTNREWTDEDYAAVFEKLSENRRWLSSVRIEAHKNKRFLTGCKFWRDGDFACNHLFAGFQKGILPFFVDAIMSSRSFFQKRGRSDSPTGRSRPIRITYSEDVFADKRQNYRLIRVLRSLPDTSLSVYHPNPYLHVGLLDYSDGSTYDVWVTTMTSILVVPKKKATTASFERLCNHICEDFEEGEVVEFESDYRAAT